MVPFEPIGEVADPFFDGDGGAEVEELLAFLDVGVGFGDLAWLHGEELLDRFFTEGLFEELDQIEQIDGAVVP